MGGGGPKFSRGWGRGTSSLSRMGPIAYWYTCYFSVGGPESWPRILAPVPLWIRAWTKSDALTWCNTTAWMLMPSENGHPNWCLYEKIKYENYASTKFLSLISHSDVSRNWLSPNWRLLEKFKFEMKSIDTNEASFPGIDADSILGLTRRRQFLKSTPTSLLRLENEHFNLKPDGRRLFDMNLTPGYFVRGKTK